MRLTVLTNTTLLYSITHFIYANSVVKRPGTSVPRRYKKNENAMVPRFFQVPVVPRTRFTRFLTCMAL